MASEAGMIQIDRPSPPAIVEELAPIVAQAKAFQVVDVGSHFEALNRIKMCRLGEKSIEASCETFKKAVQAAHKETLAFIARFVSPIAEARRIYDRTAQEYESAERKKAEEEARRLQKRARQEEEDRKLVEAQAAQDAGDKQLAETIINEPVSVPVVSVAPQISSVESVFSRTTWSAEVFDFMSLVRYVAEHQEWESLLAPNGPNLNRLAIAQHEALRFPGVRAVSTTNRSTRK